MLTDLVAMFMGLTAVLLARHGPASAARTYGWHRAEVFTAVANAVLLLGVAGFILYEAFERLGDAPDVPGVPMIVVALAGLIANVVVVLLLRSHSEGSLAVKGAYMEVVADTVGSVGVLIAGIVTVTTRWPYADVVVAVLVALWVLPRAIALARAALRILSESSPSHIDVDELRGALCGRRRRHRSARPARVDAGAGQGHGHRARDVRRRLGAGARRRPGGAGRARPRTRDRPGRAARRAPATATAKRAASGRLGQAELGARRGIAVVEQIEAARVLVGSRRSRPRPAPARPHSAGSRGWARARTAPGRSPSSRCGAAGRGRGGSPVRAYAYAVIALSSAERLLGQRRPRHRRRRMRGRDDRRILAGVEFRLGLGVAGKQDRIRPQKITHPRHAPIVPCGHYARFIRPSVEPTGSLSSQEDCSRDVEPIRARRG